MIYLNKILLKKGAIFGMDARIAIIVFGLLGAMGSYYAGNRITNAQNASFVKQVETLRQAAMQNFADNGFDYSIYGATSNSNIFNKQANDTNDLNRGKNNYTYIKEVDANSTPGLIYIQTPTTKIEVDSANLYTSTTKDLTDLATTDCAITSQDCYYWLQISKVPDSSYDDLEHHFDVNDDTAVVASDNTSGIVTLDTANSVADDNIVYIAVGSRR